MNNTKKQAKLALLGVVIVLMIFLCITFINRYKEKKKLEEFIASQPTLISQEEQTYAQEETYGDMVYNPSPLDEFPDRIMIENFAELTKAGLPVSGLELIEPYLTQYFDYYLQTGEKYKGTYVQDSYKDDYNFPSFQIYVEDLDLAIDCVYITYQELFRFTSRFNPDGE